MNRQELERSYSLRDGDRLEIYYVEESEKWKQRSYSLRDGDRLEIPLFCLSSTA